MRRETERRKEREREEGRRGSREKERPRLRMMPNRAFLKEIIFDSVRTNSRMDRVRELNGRKKCIKQMRSCMRWRESTGTPH